MAKKRVPAAMNKSHKLSQSEKDRLAILEAELKGNDDLVYTAPSYLNATERGYWTFIVENLRATSILSNLDMVLLEQICSILGYIADMDCEIKKEGTVVERTNRYGATERVANPIIKQKSELIKQVNQLMNQIGMSPSSRATLVANTQTKHENDEDPLLKLLSNR